MSRLCISLILTAAASIGLDCGDRESIISFIRRGRNSADDIVVIFNKTSVPRYHYRVGLPYVVTLARNL